MIETGKMDFGKANAQIIRSVTQRGLFLQWDRLRNGRTLPLLTELDLDGRNHDTGQLSLCSVETDDGKARYHVLREGSHMVTAYSSNWTGKYLDEVFPDHIKASALAAYDRCREYACCVYTVSSVADAMGKTVDCERLLSPFGTGAAVTHIVTSLQLISIDGGFERQNIFGSKSRPVEYSIMATVGPSTASTMSTPPA
jgi:hypothetical protein